MIFVIEKGKYNVRFDSPKDHKKPVKYVFLVPFLVSFAALIVVGAMLISSFSSTKEENVWQGLPIWQNFAKNGKKTMLVLGDYFVFNGLLPTGNAGVYRDFSINSEVEYEHLLDKNPELVQVLSKSNLTYLSKMAVFCQSNIYKVFAQTGGEIDVKLSSDVQPDDLKEYNIIFVGNYKNMGIFENVVNDLNFSFGVSTATRQFIFSTDPCAEIFEAENTTNKENDYALVIHTKGFSDNHFLFFLSAQDIGNIAVVNQLTDPSYLGQFASDNLKDKEDDFKALFEVEGIDKTDLACKLIRVE